MTTEQKQLLIKDLSARLPYGVICKSKYIEYDEIDGDDVEWDNEGKIEVIGDDYVIINSYQCEIDETKPYLRPMSDMTEEEAEELDEMNISNHTIAFYNRFKEEPHFFTKYNVIGIIDTMQYIDWLIVHHFDFRGLIPMGLALPAPEGMYNF